ncbi:hypothetical protein GCM10028856_05640 [Halopiger thermotolerans]
MRVVEFDAGTGIADGCRERLALAGTGELSAQRIDGGAAVPPEEFEDEPAIASGEYGKEFVRGRVL